MLGMRRSFADELANYTSNLDKKRRYSCFRMKKNARLLYLLTVWTFFIPFFSIASSRLADDETPAAASPSVTYVLSMPEPQTHYFEVEMQLKNMATATNAKKNGYIDIKMPVWTPGSYLIREYARNVQGFTATTGGKPLKSEKISKNTWRITTPASTDDNLTIRYRVYANELTVRTSFVDADHGYVTPASMFMYHDALRNIPLRVVVQPYKTWKNVATALEPVAGQTFTYEATDFDLLVDSPIEIGNHHTFTFTASNVPHSVAMFGEVDYDEKRLAADYKRVCEAAATVIGEHPCKHYTFIVHHIPSGGGGLEHLNSTTLETSRNAYATEANYKGFLTLVAHEYFHLWNVKRIRPVALGPFNYEAENYTHMLWLSEGGTSFYEDYILRRAGFHTPETYLNIVGIDITNIENQPGSRVQSAAESSWDAWIKEYRPNENSANTTISYYSKGSVLGTLLNLAILAGSNGERSLDDLMRFLYAEYYKKQKRGFADEEFRQAAEQIAGRSLDDFFTIGVNSAEPINYNTYFEPVGLRLVNVAGKTQDGFLGAATTVSNGKATIASVRRGSGAYTGGLNVGDEIISVDSVRVGDDLLRLIGGRRAGETIKVLVNRGGFLREIPVTLTQNPLASYRLEPLPNVSPAQKALYNKWLFIK
ncbi:Predicted metalloprotease, contains C-terminal PDZ domain [Spirosoma endophyticum]|uniref:Predicted metalloprotease, contains C-terminal PDZ domain n=2 Tax=Spirosoma endophyticum TaxID=662367 RepID=A0A1I1F9Y7_9BACT|nr:Predicted metalloprotease, contains C-terminal PDZ domain [Spirosoma endophyticum]